MHLSGVYTALVTPFAEGEVDLATFHALCDRQLDAGIAGLVPCGTTGETPTLTHGEWSSLIETAVQAAADHAQATGRRVPVIAGVGSNSTAHTVDNIRAAQRLGANAGLAVFPYYNKPNPPGLAAHVERICAEGLPIVLYHVPGRTGQRLPLAQLQTLCQTPGVVACKEATGDVAFGIDLVGALEQHARTGHSVTVLSGDDFTSAPLAAMGAHGVISVLSNLAPRLTVAWHDAAVTGDIAVLRDLRRRLQPVVSALFSQTNPVPAKAAMAVLGLCSDAVRLPLAPGTWPNDALLRGLD